MSYLKPSAGFQSKLLSILEYRKLFQRAVTLVTYQESVHTAIKKRTMKTWPNLFRQIIFKH